MTSSHPSMTQAPGVMMLRLLRFDCLQVESMQAEAAALRAQLASSQEMAAEEQQQRVGLQADLSAVQAQLTSSREQVAQAEERLQVAGLRLRQEVAASREQAKSLRAQLADAEQKRCADELRLQEQAARHQQEVAGLGAEAAQLARNNSEGERWLQGQVAMLEEKVSQLTRELAAARADAADEQEQQLGSEEALMQHEAAHQEQMAAVQATPHQQLQSWQQSLEEREAAHRQEVALLKGRIWEATGAGILAAQEQRHRSDQHEAAALRKQREQLRAACQEELRSTQRSLEAAADSRLQKQAAEHQQQEAAPMQQMDQHLAALEKQRQQQETAYKSHLAGAQSKLTELLEQAAQEQVAELQQALAPLQAELQRQTQRADRYAFEAATQMALRREAAQPAAFSQQRPDRRQAPPPLLICGNREPVDEEMADADSSIVPSLPAGPQSPRQSRSGAVPSGPASTPAAVLPHQGSPASATSTLHNTAQQQQHDSMELDGAASLPAALGTTQRRPGYLASRGAGTAPSGPCTGTKSAQPVKTASGQPHQQSQIGAGSLQGQAPVPPARTTPAGGPHAGAANRSPTAPAASGMTLPPGFRSLSASNRVGPRGSYFGRPRASPKGSKLCGASRQPQGSIDMLPAACSIASGSEPGQAPLACTPTSPALRPCAVVGFGSMLPLEPQRTTEPANSAPVQSISAALAEAGQCAGSKAAQAEPSHAPLSPEPQKQGSPSSQHGTPGQGDGRQKSGLRSPSSCLARSASRAPRQA